ISRHADGAHLAQLSARWGYHVVRGSSKRGGDVGLLGLVRHLRDGAEVALTPDGPRGPAERVKPGAVAAAQHAAALVIAVGARAASAWRVRAWGRVCVAKPFTRSGARDARHSGARVGAGGAPGAPPARPRGRGRGGSGPGRGGTAAPRGGRGRSGARRRVPTARRGARLERRGRECRERAGLALAAAGW